MGLVGYFFAASEGVAQRPTVRAAARTAENRRFIMTLLLLVGLNTMGSPFLGKASPYGLFSLRARAAFLMRISSRTVLMTTPREMSRMHSEMGLVTKTV